MFFCPDRMPLPSLLKNKRIRRNSVRCFFLPHARLLNTTFLLEKMQKCAIFYGYKKRGSSYV